MARRRQFPSPRASSKPTARKQPPNGASLFKVYVRASSPAQDESCEQQLRVAEADLRALKLLSADESLPRYHAPEAGVYVDDGISAWKFPLEERPGAGELLTDIARDRQPKDTPAMIWVWAQSRLLRPQDGAAEAVAQLYALRKLGWIVYDHKEGRVDVAGPDGLTKTITVALHGQKDAEHAREKVASVRRGKAAQAESGVWLGGFAPFGYERWVARLGPREHATQRHTVAEWIRMLPDGDRNGMQGCVTLLRPSSHAEWMRNTFRLAADGENGRVVSIAEITRRFNDDGPQPKTGVRWNRSTVNALLVNESYAAILRDPNGVAHPALWEPLVDLATWQRVQRRLQANAQQRRGVNTDFVLSGLMVCARCNGRLYGERQRRAEELGGYLDYYRAAPASTREEPCPSCRRRVRAEVVERPVLDVIAGLADRAEVRHAIAAEQAAQRDGDVSRNARRVALEHQAAEVRQQISNLLVVLERGGAVAEQAAERIDTLNRRAAQLQHDLAKLQRTVPTAAPFAESARMFRAMWENAGPAEKKDMVRCFIASVEVDFERKIVRAGVRALPGVAA